MFPQNIRQFLHPLLCFFCLLFIGEGIQNYRNNQTINWYRANGIVTGTNIDVKSSDDDTSYHPIVRYSYKDEYGIPYLGERIRFGGISFDRRDQAENFLRNYEQGRTIDVYYNPQDISKSVLLKYNSPLFTFSSIPLLLILLTLISGNIWDILQFRRYSGKTRGVITHIHLGFLADDTTDTDDSSWGDPEMYYSFDYQGVTYTSTRLGFQLHSSDKLEELVQKFVQRHSVGSEVMVYFNPRDPEQATLDISLPTAHRSLLTLYFVGIVCVLVGSFLILNPEKLAQLL